MTKKTKRVKKSPKVKAVTLPKDGVAVDHMKKVVEIAPVLKKNNSWWKKLFGD